jgi:hypothetical protein
LGEEAESIRPTYLVKIKTSFAASAAPPDPAEPLWRAGDRSPDGSRRCSQPL